MKRCSSGLDPARRLIDLDGRVAGGGAVIRWNPGFEAADASTVSRQARVGVATILDSERISAHEFALSR